MRKKRSPEDLSKVQRDPLSLRILSELARLSLSFLSQRQTAAFSSSPSIRGYSGTVWGSGQWLYYYLLFSLLFLSLKGVESLKTEKYL